MTDGWALPELPAGYSWGHTINYSTMKNGWNPSSITLRLKKSTRFHLSRTIGKEEIPLKITGDCSVSWDLPRADQKDTLDSLKIASGELISRCLKVSSE